MATHICGGTILTGDSGAQEHRYCDRCLAYTYDTDADLPTGTDRAANQAASDAGKPESPEATEVTCECGRITGERCEWSGPKGETVVVVHMPEYLRASHEAAGNAGVYPHNGAIRVRVEQSCADRLDDKWTTTN